MASALDIAKQIFIVGGFVLFGYFIIPIIFPVPLHQAIFFIVTMTGSNFVAVIASWYYFYNTRCYADEGNIVTMYSYKLVGASATHLVLLIARISGNILGVVFMVLYPETLVYEMAVLWYVKLFLLSISFGTGMYIYEMVNNLIATSHGVDFKCNERSLLCGEVKDPLFCDVD